VALVAAHFSLADGHWVLQAHRDSLANPMCHNDPYGYTQVEAVIGRDLDESVTERAVDLRNGPVFGSKQVDTKIWMNEVVQWLSVFNDFNRYWRNSSLKEIQGLLTHAPLDICVAAHTLFPR
jgi:hypothetical protein